MDAWFYVTEGRTEGPLPLDELRRRLATGVVTPSTLVWEPSLPGWRPAQVVPMLDPAATGAPAAGAASFAHGVPTFPMATISQQATASVAAIVPPSGVSATESEPSPAPTAGAFESAGARADTNQMVASIRKASPHRKGEKPRSRLGVVLAWLVALAFVAAAVGAIKMVPGLQDKVMAVLSGLQAKLTNYVKGSPLPPESGETPPFVVPPLADPAGLSPGPPDESTPQAIAAPTGASAGYQCPLEKLDAEWQAPRRLGAFERTDLSIEDSNPEKQWAYFYTCRYNHPKLGEVGHKVLTFEKHRGETLAAEYTRAAVDNLQPARRLIHQEDVVAPKNGGRLGRIFVLGSKTGSDVIWHNGRHFLHIEAPTIPLALEFKKQLAY